VTGVKLNGGDSPLNGVNNATAVTVTVPGTTDNKDITLTAASADDSGKTLTFKLHVASNVSVSTFEVAPNFDNKALAATYRVASSDVETILQFTSKTTTSVSSAISSAVWTAEASPTNVAANVSGDSNTITGTTLSNVGTVNIPADYVGTITVTVKAGNDASKTASFTLNVNTLQNTVNACSAQDVVGYPNINDSLFIVGNKMWRVLSKTMSGSGHTGGTDILILSEHVLNYTAQWNTSNTTSGGYIASNIRTVTLKDLYQNDLAWAHSYAVLPNRGDSAWSQNNNETTNLTKSTGTAVPTTGGDAYLDGAFLLSYADMFTGLYGFVNNSTEYDTSRVVTGTGAERWWWLRSPGAANNPWEVGRYGDGMTDDASTLRGLRPALLLNLSS
jgi:hypothetical protein